jgi:hypothetical protein
LSKTKIISLFLAFVKISFNISKVFGAFINITVEEGANATFGVTN